jgi:hypothetical protein
VNESGLLAPLDVNVPVTFFGATRVLKLHPELGPTKIGPSAIIVVTPGSR